MGELFASDRLGIRDETVSSASSIDSPQSIWTAPRDAGANLLHPIGVGGVCNTDNDSNSIVTAVEWVSPGK